MKNTHWNLDALYTSFEDPLFVQDKMQMTEQLDNLLQFAQDNFNEDKKPPQVIYDFIKKLEAFYQRFSRLMSFCSLTLAVETDNKEASNHLSALRNHTGKLALLNSKFNSFMKDQVISDLIEEVEELGEYQFFLKEVKKDAEYLLSEKEEVLYAKLRNTGSTAFSTLQNELTSNLMIEVEIKGEKKTLPLPAVRNLANDQDPEVRKAAFEAELASYSRIERSSAACLNAIKGEVITMAELRGYESPLRKTIEDSRMDKETLDALLSAMQEKLPVFRNYLRAKARHLGYKNGLPFYELFAPIGKSSMSFTYEEAMEYIIGNFKKVSTRLADFVTYAYEHEWLDVEPREGKRGGAFCSNLHSIGESRVMSNFSGSFSNMTTLAHELGHAYHGFNLKGESILNSSYTMPIAETASIFNETLITNMAIEDASDEEALAILEDSISGSTQVIVDIYSRYLFETMLFDARVERVLNAEDLKNMMLEAQRQSYGDGLDQEVLHPYMWLNKPHYYSSGLSFYNFPYAFGLLFSRGLYYQFKNQPEGFMEKYDELLRNTGRMNIYDAAMSVGIDVHQKEFFLQSIQTIEDEIEEFIRRVEHD